MRIAIAQLEHSVAPGANLEAALAAIEHAGQQGAQLIAFPETWLPGYPAWLDVCRDAALWDNPRVKAVYRTHFEQSLTIPGPEVTALGEAAAKAGVAVVMGAVERGGVSGHGTLYNVLITIGSDGVLLNHHRKLMPTFTERLVWGLGDARGVRVVTAADARIGGLICWEHWMPLPRQALHEAEEQLHIAAWPHVKEMNLVASRHYAFEGRCFVLCTGAIMRASQLPADLERMPGLADDALVLRGGSCVIGPDGAFITEPLYDRAELLITDVDLGRAAEERMTLDVAGHYARPDLFRLQRLH